MKYYTLGFLLLLALPQTVMAAATATLDRSITSLGESVQLTIQVDGSVDQDPDLSVLKADFEILRQNQHSSYSLLNSNFKRNVQWSIVLMPKREGALTIPSISLGNMQTKPLTLRVLLRVSASSEEKDDIFLQVSTSAAQVYVQGQIILTVKLFRAVNLLQAQLSEPDMPNMLMQKLGEDKNYETVVSQRRFVVAERRYALFPQQSGILQIPPLQFDGSIASVGGYGALNQGRRTVRLYSEVIDIRVLPMPDSWKNGKLWLPAGKVTLHDITDEVAHDVLTLGEPLTRTIEIRAEGLTAEQLPLLTAPLDVSFKQYPDQAILTTEVGLHGVVGVRSEKVVLIPTEEGSFVLPAISVAWWDVQAQQMQVETIPARNVRVLAVGETAAAEQYGAPEHEEEFVFSRYDDLFMWQWISMILAVGWFITVMLWWYRAVEVKKRLKRRQENYIKKALTLKVLRQRLDSACQRHDLKEAALLLPEWGGLVLRNSNVLHYSQLRGYASALDKAFNQMELSLYGKNAQRTWSGDALLAALPLLKPTGKYSELPAGLKPLYP